jgi:hypothetical protein
LDPAALLDRLAASLDALGTGAVDLPERQRTLRATMEWSVGLLTDAERSLLEVVAVFVDGWTIPGRGPNGRPGGGPGAGAFRSAGPAQPDYLDSTGPGARSRLALGWVSIAGDPDGAIRQASATLEEFRGQDEPFWTALAVLGLVSVKAATGRDEDAVRDLTEERELADRFGYDWLATWSRVQLGTLGVLGAG